MEFLCLNCFETFNVDDDKLPEAGGLLKCPVCGHKQPFAGVKTSNPTIKAKRRVSGEYRMVRKDTNKEKVFTDVKKSEYNDHAHEKHEKTKSKAPSPVDEKNAKSPIYRVVSPSGLTFEFQDLQILVHWGEMVANSAPYRVYSDEKEEPVSLEEILNDKSSIRKYKKRAVKMREAAEAEAVASGEKPSADADKDDEPTLPDDKRDGPVTTREFQFRTEVKEEKKWPMFVIYIVLAAFFGAASLFAFYVYFFQGKGG